MEHRPARKRRKVGCSSPTSSVAAAFLICPSACPHQHQRGLDDGPTTGRHLGCSNCSAMLRGQSNGCIGNACRKTTGAPCAPASWLWWARTGMTNASTSTVSPHVVFLIRFWPEKKPDAG